MMRLRTAAAHSLTVVFLLGLVACARPGAPLEQGPGTVSSARKFLEGQWTLESFQVIPPGQAPVTLGGQGTLVYDDFGNLQMEIRADEKASDLLRAAGIDIRDGVISTQGRTVIDLQHRTLTYVMEGQQGGANPGGPLALTRPRHWEVEANLLTLTTRDDQGKPLSVSRWRRAK